jgi:HD-like signal output (HDOD) protein/CheY-like chemotaxis protein
MKTILVVDDLAVFREPLEVLLKGQGFRVLSAADGELALEVLEHDIPDLILLDLGMPVLDGIEVLRQVRQSARWKEIPVLVLSAAADKVRVSMAAKLGIVGYVLKSRMSLQQVMERIRQIVGADQTATAVPRPSKALVADQGVVAASTNGGSNHVTAARSDRMEPIGICRFAAPEIGHLQPLMTRGELMNQLSKCEELQGFAPAVQHGAVKAADDRCSLDELARVVRLDPMLSLRVLRMANTQAYARSERIDSVARAVIRLGLENVRHVIAAAGEVGRFVPERVEPYIHPGQFWEHSVACGIIASELAAPSGVHEAEVAFTCGLLHDLGRLACAQLLGEAYIAVLHAAQHSGALLEQVESKMLLLNHADVADRILQTWKAPRQIVDPVLYHHLSPSTVRGIAPAHAEMVLRVGLADRLAHALMLGHSGNAAIYHIEEHCHLLGVDAGDIDRVSRTAREQMAKLRKDIAPAAWTPWSETVRTRLECEFRPTYFSLEPEVDGFGVFCQSLTAGERVALPTIAVISLTHENDGVMLRDAIEAWAAVPAHANLPVIVLLGPEAGTIPDYLIHGQPLAVISTPFAVSRFIDAVKLVCCNHAARKAA